MTTLNLILVPSTARAVVGLCEERCY